MNLIFWVDHRLVITGDPAQSPVGPPPLSLLSQVSVNMVRNQVSFKSVDDIYVFLKDLAHKAVEFRINLLQR